MSALAFLAGPLGRWLVVGLALVAAIGGAWWRGHSSGLDAGRAEIRAAWDREKLRAQDVALRAEAAAREQEHSMAASVAAVADHYVKENARATAQTADLRRRLADGSLRLNVPALSSTAPLGKQSFFGDFTAGKIPGG